MASYYYLNEQNTPAGPVDTAGLSRMLAEGLLTPASLVAMVGETEWQPLSAVITSFAAVPSGPPPLPSSLATVALPDGAPPIPLTPGLASDSASGVIPVESARLLASTAKWAGISTVYLYLSALLLTGLVIVMIVAHQSIERIVKNAIGPMPGGFLSGIIGATAGAAIYTFLLGYYSQKVTLGMVALNHTEDSGTAALVFKNIARLLWAILIGGALFVLLGLIASGWAAVSRR